MATTSGIRAGRAFVELFADDTMLVRGLRRAEARVRKFGTIIQNIGRRLGTLGLAASIPVALSVKTFADFDDRMRAVKAAVAATADEFETLTAKAKKLGRTTSFSAVQVAESMLELARAGFSPTMIDDSIGAMLDLSRATGTNLAQATELAVNTMYSFELPASEMTHVCDVLVAAANGAAMTLEDLGFSMSYCAPIAKEYGLTLEETSKIIGSLSNYGIKASQAGTAFRRILTNFADDSIQRKLKNLGVSVIDIDTGKMRDVSAVLRDLGKATANMAKDKKLILFRDLFDLWAMAAGAKLTVAQFDKMYAEIDNAGNVARSTAQEMDSGIGGSLRRMWSVVEGVAIAVGGALAPELQKLTDWLVRGTSGVIAYIDKNKELVVQAVKIIAAITGIGGALFGLGIGFRIVSMAVGGVTTMLAGLLNILLLPINLIGKLVNVVLFAGAAIVNVFSAVGLAVYRAAAFLTLFARTFYAATNRIGDMLIFIVTQSVRAVSLLSSGLVSATMLIGRAVTVSLTTILPVVGRVFGAMISLLTPLASVVGTLLAGVFTRVGVLITRLSIYFAPLVSTTLWAMNLIGAAISGAFISITGVIRASFANVGAAIAATVARAITAMSGLAARFFAQIGTMVAAFFVRLAGTAGTALVVVAAQTSTTVGHLAWTVAAQMAYVVGIVGVVVAQCIAAVGAAMTSLLLAMSPWTVVVLTIGAVAGAVFLLVRNIGTIASVLTTVFRTVMKVVSTVVSGIVTAVMGVLGFLLRPIMAIVAWIASGIWSLVTTIGSAIGSAIGSVVSSIRESFASAWNGVVGMFASVLSAISGIVGNFGTFFSQALAALGETFDWFKGKIGEVFGFFKESYDAIAVALGRGDIEAALGVVWAGLKLIWVKGTHVLLESWYWLTDTLQTAWANCVFKISELLLTAWYGVQQFWTETVYTMQTLWTGFMDSLIASWQYAEKLIKKGVGYIKALWQGTDPKEVLTGIDDEYDRKAKEREQKRMADLNAIQHNRDTNQAAFAADKQGAIGLLKNDLAADGVRRQAERQAKVAGFEQEYKNARLAYDDAINRAKTPPDEEYSPWDMKTRQPNPLAGLEKTVASFKGLGGLSGLLGDKMESSGTFSAFEIGGLNDGIAEDQLVELRSQTALLRNLKFKGIPWKED